MQGQQPGQVQTLQRFAVPHLALEVFPVRRQLVLELDRVSVTYLEGSWEAQQRHTNQLVRSCSLQCVVAVLCAQLLRERVLASHVCACGDVTLLWGCHAAVGDSGRQVLSLLLHAENLASKGVRAACPRACLQV